MNNKLLLVILFLGLALRLININQSFWLDEASQAQQSSNTLSNIWFGRGIDFHPPLFYFLSHFWLLLGSSEFWARLLPISFGMLNILVVYALARNVVPKYALFPAFFLAIAPFHIYYSQEFRSYSLLCLLGTIAMHFLYRKKFSWLAITNILLLYTHYSAIFLIFSEFVYVFFYSRKRLKKFLLLNSAFLILYLPWTPQFLNQLHAGSNIDDYLPGWRNVLSVSPLKAFPITLFKLVAGRISFLSKMIYGVYILFIFAVSFAAFVMGKHPAKDFFSVWLIVPFLAMLTSSLAIPQNQPFRIIYILPAIIFLFTFAAIRFPKTFLTVIIYISMTGNIAYYTRPRLQREQWRQAISFLTQKKATTIIKFSDAFAPFSWYSPNFSIIPSVPSFPSKESEVSAVLNPVLTNNNQVYLLEYLTDLTDPERIVDKKIAASGFAQTKIYNYEGVGFIYEYVKTHE